MMKSKTQDLAPIGRLPQGNPVEAISDYYQSKMEDTIVRKPPVWDSAGKTSFQQKERAREAANVAEMKLAECRELQILKREKMDGQWESLRERQLKFRQSFIKFNKFVCENLNKRERAVQRIALDTVALKLKIAETEHIKKELQAMTEVCEDLEEFLSNHTMYEDYLLSVVADQKDFKQPTDVLNRFETIANVKKILSIKQEKDLAEIMELHSEMSELTENRSLQMMGLNNTLAKLRLRYGNALYESNKWEIILKRAKEITKGKQVELSRVRDSLWDFYCTICKQKGMEPTALYEDFDTQVIYVYKGIKELRDIVLNIRKKMSKDAASNINQTLKKV